VYPFRLSLAAPPYWNGDTYRAILRSILSGAILDGPDLQALRVSLLDRLGGANAVLCGSGSLALELALHACGVRAGDEVVLPSFCCTAVVPPILAAGATPVLADVGAELNLTVETVQDALTQKTKAVIVPHLFGNPAEIDRISELADTRNIRVIDDAAQALGATIAGRPVGSFGDAGVLSFGSEKICSGIGGGIVLARDDQIAAEFSRTKISMAQLSPTLRHLLSETLSRRMRCWLVHTDFTTPEQPPIPYRREQMSHVAAAVAASLVQKLENNIAARRARVQAYRTLLHDCSAIELIDHREGSACLTQVIRVVARRNDDPAVRLVTFLRRAGCDVRGSYVPIHLLRSFDQCVWDRLPNTDCVWPHLVELPCHPNDTLAEVERVATLIRRANGV
jgi:perosamine synthetase